MVFGRKRERTGRFGLGESAVIKWSELEDMTK